MIQSGFIFEKIGPDLGYKYNTQKRKIYSWLCVNGSIANGECIMLGCFRYGQRLKEIRADLEPHGWRIRTEMQEGGRCDYHLEKI